MARPHQITVHRAASAHLWGLIFLQTTVLYFRFIIVHAPLMSPTNKSKCKTHQTGNVHVHVHVLLYYCYCYKYKWLSPITTNF